MSTRKRSRAEQAAARARPGKRSKPLPLTQAQEALWEQIQRCTSYWAEHRTWSTARGALDVYLRGVGIAAAQARQDASEQAGGPVRTRGRRALVSNGDKLVAFDLDTPGGLLHDAPDDNDVDLLVQLGAFGGQVFG